jgi:hypothetical protein
MCLLRVRLGSWTFTWYQSGFLTMMGFSLPSVEHVFGQKLSHVRGRVKVPYIAKVCLFWEVYKPWCPLLSQGVLRERIGPSLPVHTCLDNSTTREGVCLVFPLLSKAYFKSEIGPMNFYMGHMGWILS